MTFYFIILSSASSHKLLHLSVVLRSVQNIIASVILLEGGLQVRDVLGLVRDVVVLHILQVTPVGAAREGFEHLLMSVLILEWRILVELIFVLVRSVHQYLLENLGSTQSRVQHFLIVAHKGHLALELLAPVVLGL